MLPLLLVGAPLDDVEHRPGGRRLALLFLVLVLFRLLGLATALVLARHRYPRSFILRWCLRERRRLPRAVGLQADGPDLFTMLQSRPNSDHPSRLVLNMIIISESSAEATQPERTGRYTPARRRSSAPRNDTPRYANAWPISVHTEEVTGSIRVSPTHLKGGRSRVDTLGPGPI